MSANYPPRETLMAAVFEAAKDAAANADHPGDVMCAVLNSVESTYALVNALYAAGLEIVVRK